MKLKLEIKYNFGIGCHAKNVKGSWRQDKIVNNFHFLFNIIHKLIKILTKVHQKQKNYNNLQKVSQEIK